MKRLVHTTILLIALFSLFSCTEKEVLDIVPDNSPPYDTLVNRFTKENYINKVYISLLGRKASPEEFEESYAIIDEPNLSIESRHTLLNQIFKGQEYINKQYEFVRIEYLNGVDTSTISLYLIQLEFQLENLEELVPPELYDLYKYRLEYEIKKLRDLKESPISLYNSTITTKDMQKFAIYNVLYDEINMGTENFVLSVFESFAHRSPLVNEKKASINMVDGTSDILFLKNGQSKIDFIDIFFDSNDYYEGQVVALFKKYLFRSPTSSEIAFFANIYKSNQDHYPTLQAAILTLDEYVGI